MHNLSSTEVYSLLKQGAIVQDAAITDTLRLLALMAPGPRFSDISQRIAFTNCRIAKLETIDCGFIAHFTMDRCIVENASFEPTYFLGGATFSTCEFMNDVGFMSMGDTGQNQPFLLSNCIFHGFVNMFDAFFRGPIEISSCTFLKGTNLLGNKGQPYHVNFGVPPIIKGNTGKLDIDDDRTYISWPYGDLEEHYKLERTIISNSNPTSENPSQNPRVRTQATG